jgi:biotin carboxyl carrier protein
MTIAAGPDGAPGGGEERAGEAGPHVTTTREPEAGERTQLVHHLGPRARLSTAEGDHQVLLLPIRDPGREAAGIQRVEVVIDGWRFEIDVEPPSRTALRERATRAGGEATRGGPLEVRAIIPGRILSVEIADGDAVEAGQRLLVVEAMKMQNELRSPRAGTVRGVAVGPGQTVELGELLLVVE